MINPKKRIQQAFVTALTGLVYDGETVGVYIYPPSGNLTNYIQIGTVTTVEDGCKDVFGHECTIDIQVVSQPNGNYGSAKPAEEIADLITNTLKPTPTSTVAIPDFNMIYIVLDNGFNDGGLDPTNRSYRTINQYRFNMMQSGTVAPWILADSTWNDSGVWVDSETWNDGP